jgi:hypothetical protein
MDHKSCDARHALKVIGLTFLTCTLFSAPVRAQPTEDPDNLQLIYFTDFEAIPVHLFALTGDISDFPDFPLDPCAEIDLPENEHWPANIPDDLYPIQGTQRQQGCGHCSFFALVASVETAVRRHQDGDPYFCGMYGCNGALEYITPIDYGSPLIVGPDGPVFDDTFDLSELTMVLCHHPNHHCAGVRSARTNKFARFVGVPLEDRTPGSEWGVYSDLFGERIDYTDGGCHICENPQSTLFQVDMACGRNPDAALHTSGGSGWGRDSCPAVEDAADNRCHIAWLLKNVGPLTTTYH